MASNWTSKFRLKMYLSIKCTALMDDKSNPYWNEFISYFDSVYKLIYCPGGYDYFSPDQK
jgi:hypothetical protein